MTHPTFRPGPCPFWRAEATTRHRRLVDRFNRPQDVVRLYRSTADGLPELFPGQSVDLLWQEALQNLAPAGLLRRLTEVVRAEGFLGVLVEAISTVAAAKPLVNGCITADEVLVINRENLRDLLGRVGSDDQPTKVVLSAADLASELTTLAQWLARWSASPDPWGTNLMTLGDFNIDRRDDPLNPAFTSTGLRPPDVLNFIPRTIFDDPDPTAVPDRGHFYRRIARALRILGRLRVTDVAVTNEGRWRHAICKYLGQELLRARVRAVFA